MDTCLDPEIEICHLFHNWTSNKPDYLDLLDQEMGNVLNQMNIYEYINLFNTKIHFELKQDIFRFALGRISNLTKAEEIQA